MSKKSTWLNYRKQGLSMKVLNEEENTIEFTFEHDSEYQKYQFMFFDAIDRIDHVFIIVIYKHFKDFKMS